MAPDRALLSRADLIEDIGLPNPEARKEIIADVLTQLATQWPKVADLKAQMAAYVHASDGLDGRRLRKSIITAAASSIETAKDLNTLRPEQIVQTLKHAVGQAAIAEKAA
jgi:hypothetical protein